MDPELQEVFNYAVSKGVNLFDTADSYGTGKLNGRCRGEIRLMRVVRAGKVGGGGVSMRDQPCQARARRANT